VTKPKTFVNLSGVCLVLGSVVFLVLQIWFGISIDKYTHTTISRPFFQDHPDEPVPEENFWTLWCKGRLTEADTPTIRLGATPSGLLPNQQRQSTDGNIFCCSESDKPTPLRQEVGW